MQAPGTPTIRIGYFPGCSLHGGGRDYDESVRAVSRAAGVELVEIPDWNCCGATAAHSVNKKLALALPARNLALAREAGLEVVFAPCAACYNRLLSAHRALEEGGASTHDLPTLIGRSYDGRLRVVNAVEYASDIVMRRLPTPSESRLSGVRLVSYYGCLLVRPPKVTKFDDPEDPTSMDKILSALGATVLDWEYKVECCGAGHSLARTDIVLKLASRILAAAREAGADGIVTACPMCHTNLDLRQMGVMRKEGLKAGIPVYYLTEIIGLAAGIDEAVLGVKRHYIAAKGLTARQKAI